MVMLMVMLIGLLMGLLIVEHNNGNAHGDANGVAPCSDANVDTNDAAHGDGHVDP